MGSKFAGTDVVRGALVVIVAFALGVFVMTKLTADDSSTSTQQEAADDEFADPTSEIRTGQTNKGGFEVDPSLSSQITPPGATTTATPETTTDEMPTTTAAPTTTVIKPKDVNTYTVVVLNGVDGAAGIAGASADILNEAGFQMAPSGNATDRSVEESAIFYAEGFEIDAQQVANVFKAPATVIKPLPADSLAEDQGDASIVVLLGSDGQLREIAS